MSSPQSVTEQKQAVRRAVRLTRDALSYALVLDWSARIIKQLQKLPVVANAPAIFTYVSVKNEVRTRDFIELLWERGVDVLVPSMVAEKLGMCQLHDRNEIHVDSYGRCTPSAAAQLVTDAPLVALVPGLAFTESGQRLGSGYGHYDRFIASHPHVTYIGLAYELQLQPTLPTEAHDKGMDYVVTQDRVLACSND